MNCSRDPACHRYELDYAAPESIFHQKAMFN